MRHRRDSVAAAREALAREQQRLCDARIALEETTSQVRRAEPDSAEFEKLAVALSVAKARVDAVQLRVIEREQSLVEAEERLQRDERNRLRAQVQALDVEIQRREGALTADAIAFDARAAAAAREIDSLVAQANELEGRAGDFSPANARRRTFWPAAMDEPLRVASSHPEVVSAAHARRTTRA